MINRLLIYESLLAQLRERQKKLTLIRNIIAQLEESGQPLDSAKRHLSNILVEINNLQDRISNFPTIRRFA